MSDWRTNLETIKAAVAMLPAEIPLPMGPLVNGVQLKSDALFALEALTSHVETVESVAQNAMSRDLGGQDLLREREDAGRGCCLSRPGKCPECDARIKKVVERTVEEMREAAGMPCEAMAGTPGEAQRVAKYGPRREQVRFARDWLLEAAKRIRTLRLPSGDH